MCAFLFCPSSVSSPTTRVLFDSSLSLSAESLIANQLITTRKTINFN